MVMMLDVGVSSSLSLSGTSSRICQADILTENQGMPSSAPVQGGNTSILVRINRSRAVRNGNAEERDPLPSCGGTCSGSPRP